MKIESGLDGGRARVEMVPLLDVLLIVLIFFLYLSLTLTSTRAIDVSLPKAAGRATTAQVVMVVTRGDRIMVDGRTVTAPQAVAFVTSRERPRGGPSVLLRSDRASQLGVSIELLSLLRRAGIDRVAIEVDGR